MVSIHMARHRRRALKFGPHTSRKAAAADMMAPARKCSEKMNMPDRKTAGQQAAATSPRRETILVANMARRSAAAVSATYAATPESAGRPSVLTAMSSACAARAIVEGIMPIRTHATATSDRSSISASRPVERMPRLTAQTIARAGMQSRLSWWIPMLSPKRYAMRMRRRHDSCRLRVPAHFVMSHTQSAVMNIDMA